MDVRLVDVRQHEALVVRDTIEQRADVGDEGATLVGVGLCEQFLRLLPRQPELVQDAPDRLLADVDAPEVPTRDPLNPSLPAAAEGHLVGARERDAGRRGERAVRGEDQEQVRASLSRALRLGLGGLGGRLAVQPGGHASVVPNPGGGRHPEVGGAS